MKKALFIFLVIIIGGNNMFSQKPDCTIYFDNGKATLSNESKITLKNLIENIKSRKSPNVTISGFTDENSNREFNLALSKKRALAVSDYFTTNGIEQKIITIHFFGEDRPIAKDKQNLQENRRVEIAIGTTRQKDGKNSLGIYGRLWKTPVKHIFSATKVAANEDLVMDSYGTKIWLKGNSLCRQNGEPAMGDVDIELTEYYKIPEMLLANILTIADSAMIELKGAINLVARSGGEILSLKNGSEIGIQFMVPKEEQDIAVFTGSRSGNQMNWKPQLNSGIAAREMPASFIGSYQGLKRPSKDNLVLSSSRLGWISCSKFSKIETKTNLSVEIDPMYHAIVRLVFKDLHAIMPGYDNGNGTFEVINIPVGQKATIVAFGMVKETPYFISKDIVIISNQTEKLIPKITTFETLRTILKVN